MKQIFQESWEVVKYEMIAAVVMVGIIILIVVGAKLTHTPDSERPCDYFEDRTLESLPVRCIDYYFGER